MARLARVVVPDHPHHVTQRGVRSINIFRDEKDRRAYLLLLSESCKRQGVEILTWCLMDNHVHFIAIPRNADALAKAFGEAHRQYTRHHNQRDGVTGYLFQGRFGSYVMDQSHLLSAARYVLMNPIRTNMVKHPLDWPWSSARFHFGQRKTDPLIKDNTLMGLVPNWKAFMKRESPAEEADAVSKHIATGRPAGPTAFIKQLEVLTGRSLMLKKRGWIKGLARGKAKPK